MRKEFKNVKAKHGLNSKNWKRRQIGIRPNMALLLRPKYLLVYKNRRESSKTERRRREEKKRREGKEEEEEEKRRRKKRSSRKIQRYRTMNSCMEFSSFVWILVWIFRFLYETLYRFV